MTDNTITFNAETYADNLRAFGNSLRTTDGKSDKYAQTALAALIVGMTAEPEADNQGLSPMALAISVYSEMEPKTAAGKAAEPKESDKAPCGVSVSSIRSAKGGEGAKATLEAIFYIAENRSHDADAVADFILGKRGAFRLFPLKKHLQSEKAKAAKAEAASVTATASEDKEGMDVPETADVSNPLTIALAFVQGLDGDALTAASDDIELLLVACQEAAERLAAAETLRTGTEG